MLYFLPSIVSMLWFITFLFKVKNSRQKTFMGVLGLGTYYFATYAIYVHPQNDYMTMVKMDALNVPVIMMLISTVALYMWQHLCPRRPDKSTVGLMLTPAIVLGAITSILYYLVGFENAARLVMAADKGLDRPSDLETELVRMYVFFDTTMIDVFGLVFQFFIISLCVITMRRQGYRFGDVFRFFFKGSSSTPSRVIAFLQLVFVGLTFPIVMLGREVLTESPILGATTTVMFAIVMHFIAHVEFFTKSSSTVTLHDLSHIGSGEAEEEDGSNDDAEDEGAGGADTAESTEGSVEEAAPAQRGRRAMRTEIIVDKIVSLFEEEEIYRKDDLTLDMLSQKVGVGRGTLSAIINQHYGEPFRDVVNRYRVEAVKKFLIDNPSTTQEAAAYECGYKDASSLNRKFRELENDTPLMWLTHHQAGGASK